MQWWANFLSVVGQLVGRDICQNMPCYRHVHARMCARNAYRKESNNSMINTFVTVQTSQDTI